MKELNKLFDDNEFQLINSKLYQYYMIICINDIKITQRRY